MHQEKSAMLLRKSRADLEAEAEAQGLDTLARHEERLDELAKSLGIVVRKEDRYEMQRFMESVRNRKYRSTLVVDVFYR